MSGIYKFGLERKKVTIIKKIKDGVIFEEEKDIEFIKIEGILNTGEIDDNWQINPKFVKCNLILNELPESALQEAEDTLLEIKEHYNMLENKAKNKFLPEPTIYHPIIVG